VCVCVCASVCDRERHSPPSSSSDAVLVEAPLAPHHPTPIIQPSLNALSVTNYVPNPPPPRANNPQTHRASQHRAIESNLRRSLNPIGRKTGVKSNGG
jgi:hypothetical protein